MPDGAALIDLYGNELRTRRLAKTSLAAYASYVEIPNVPIEQIEDAWDDTPLDVSPPQRELVAHHRVICDAIQNVTTRVWQVDGQPVNVMLFFPPGSAKSTYADVVAAPHFMASQPRGLGSVLLASHGTDIAEKQGRKARQLVRSKRHTNIFPDATLSSDRGAAGNWILSNGAEFYAAGLLSGITGSRCALGILDDPLRGREAAESLTQREKGWDAYLNDFCSRLLPGASQILIMCMVGSTQVLMADGVERALRDIKVGDIIATYSAGKLELSTIERWINQGEDDIFEIRTESGAATRANARHPFLVEREGKRRWIRLQDLMPGDKMVRLSGELGKTQLALAQDANEKPDAKECATSITPNSTISLTANRRRLIQPLFANAGSKTDTALRKRIMKRWQPNKADCVLYAESHREPMSERVGAESCASITTTKPERSVACSATIATLPLDTEKTKQPYAQPQSTSDFTLDSIVSITYAGREDVFDVQVARTENFIADGFVSHNTRWHQDDIAGRILPESWAGESGLLKGRDGRWWYVICAPAIADRADDPIGRSIGEGLWPEWFKTGHWEPFKVNARTWNSLYQQKPTAPSGTFFKRAWFDGGQDDGKILPTRRYNELPKSLNIYLSSDHARTADGGDYTVLRVWGIDKDRHVYWIDGYRGQSEPAIWMHEAIRLIKQYRPLCWFAENDTIFGSVEPFIRTQMRDKLAICRIEKLSTRGDKVEKAQGFQGMAQMGMVHHPYGAAANEAIEECVAFPGGVHDDEVDCGSAICRALMDAHPAIVLSKAPAETRLDAWGNREPAPESDWRVA